MRLRILLFLAALLPRLILPLVGPVIGFSGIVSDSPTYLIVAESLADGEGFADADGNPTAFRPPAYPVFLAGILPISGTKGVQILQAILAALLAPMLYELLSGAIGRRCAIAAALVFAFDPISIPTPAFILTESIGSVLLLLWVSAMRRRALIFAAVVAGALIYQTMITLLLHPLALLVRRPNIRRAVLSLLIFLLPLTAWTVRNKVVLGDATAVRSAGFGFLLWATVHYDFPWLLSPYDPRGAHIIEQETRADPAFFLSDALDQIREQPLISAIRIVKASFWGWIEIPGAMKMLDDFPAVRWTLLGANIAILAAAAFGARRACRDPVGRIAIGVVIYFGIFLAPLWPIPRYFLPIRPMLAILAGFACRQALDHRARKLAGEGMTALRTRLESRGGATSCCATFSVASFSLRFKAGEGI